MFQIIIIGAALFAALIKEILIKNRKHIGCVLILIGIYVILLIVLFVVK